MEVLLLTKLTFCYDWTPQTFKVEQDLFYQEDMEEPYSCACFYSTLLVSMGPSRKLDIDWFFEQDLKMC